jgi:hypothetical protein
MTKINAWKCDICGKDFDKFTGGYKANVGFGIVIPSGSQFEKETIFEFEDTCLNCRMNLINAIESLINKDTEKIEPD